MVWLGSPGFESIAQLAAGSSATDQDNSIQMLNARAIDGTHDSCRGDQELWDVGYDWQENSCSSDRSSGRANRRDGGGAITGNRSPNVVQ
jgi:hypothetical protein